jgi:PqqD family protein of HPr-rel-A system
MRFRTNPASVLHWRQWDDEYVVFNEVAGQTHVLDTLTACALLCIESGATDLPALVSDVITHTELSADSVTKALPFVLEQLSQAALVDIIDG